MQLAIREFIRDYNQRHEATENQKRHERDFGLADEVNEERQSFAGRADVGP